MKENTVLIIQTSKLQTMIWEKILDSQNISLTIKSPSTDLASVLLSLEQVGKPLPQLLLLEPQLPDFNPKTFYSWCAQNYPDLKIILLSPTLEGVSFFAKEVAIQCGALEVLPPFQVETLALSAIKALKPVLAALGGIPQQNDALAATIITVKRDIESKNWETQTENRDNSKQESAENGFVELETNLQSESIFASSLQPQELPDSTPKKRLYRGRSY